MDRYHFTFHPRKKGLRKILGDLEADVMEAIWARGRATVHDVHERLAWVLGRQAGVDALVALLRADWTTRDPVVTRALAAFGRNSVPFIVVYPRARDAAPIILPTLLTSGIVTGALERAAASPSRVRTSAALTSGRIVPSPSLEVTP